MCFSETVYTNVFGSDLAEFYVHFYAYHYTIGSEKFAIDYENEHSINYDATC